MRPQGSENMTRIPWPKMLTATLIAALFSAPLAYGSTDFGPKTHCETPSEWGTHHYGAGNAAFAQPVDGNLEECGFSALVDDCSTIEELGVDPTFGQLLCNTDRPADFDGHYDWGAGGAFLTVNSPSADCATGELPHHSASISVVDAVRGSDTLFNVGADYDCDGLIDDHEACYNTCTPEILPGSDGGYYVLPFDGAGGRVTDDTGTSLTNECNGTADDYCQYCAYRGSSSASDPNECDDDDPLDGYRWTGCRVWVNGTCVYG